MTANKIKLGAKRIKYTQVQNNPQTNKQAKAFTVFLI